MEKLSKKTKKSPKIKKRQQPLKVVYITNPIKFETSALEFRALVQELTGQYADVAYSASEGHGGGEAVKAAEETKSGQLSGGVEDDAFVSSLMLEGHPSHLFDILQNLDAM